MSITPYESAPAPVQVSAPIDLQKWAYEAGAVHKMADALARTSFVPAALQGRADEIAAQILYGREVNMSPMIALQQIHIIERRPSISALAMRGLAQSNGVKFRYDEMTETRCKMSALAPGDAAWTTVVWSIDRAKKLGLTTKSNWTKQPQAMLIARATSELCRLVAAPLFLGMAYSTEELRDGVDVIDDDAPQTESPAPRESNARKIRRKPVETVELPDPPQDGTPVTTETRKALLAQFNDAGIDSRDDRLAYVSKVLKRTVTSMGDCSEEDGREILAQLHLDAPFTTRHEGEWTDAVVAELPEPDDGA